MSAFDEWSISQGYKHPEYGIQVSPTQYTLMRNAWNAAVLVERERCCRIIDAMADQSVQAILAIRAGDDYHPDLKRHPLDSRL